MTRARDLANIADGTFTATDLDLSGTLTVSGDATFDTNTLFVDVSANNVGIGTSSPTQALHVNGNSLISLTKSYHAYTTDYGMGTPDSSGLQIFTGSSDSIRFGHRVSGTFTEDARVDLSGNFSIGTTGTDFASAGRRVLRVEGSTNALMSLSDGTSHFYLHQKGGTSGVDIWNVANSYMRFAVNNNEKMRINTSGNLLVGTTDSDLGYTDGDSGVVINGDGPIQAARDSANAIVYLNKLNNDGAIIQMHKDGNTLATIGTVVAGSANQLYINSDDVGLRFRGSDDSIVPCTSAGAFRDNAIDLGLSTARFDDIYATNSTIQTSDANEKQDIAELDEAERRVAVAAKGLLRKFRWIDSVEAKGDEARIHFGIIAQDLQAAFEAEGLDAGRYAMFIHSTWTDEETGEERSRMGVRYSELLAFIIAAL